MDGVYFPHSLIATSVSVDATHWSTEPKVLLYNELLVKLWNFIESHYLKGKKNKT